MADVVREQARLAEREQYVRRERQQNERRHRQQHRQQETGPVDMRHAAVVLRAARVRDADADRGQHALQQRDDHEKEVRAETAGGERVGAQRAEQDRVGHAHRHLRQLRDRERGGEPRGVGRVAG
ncbi:hypothetical protein QFZ96_003269 [Paraburkholderia youngii]